MSVTLASALDRLHDRGHRLTRPRQAVLEALFGAEDWLRPEQVLIYARERLSSVGLVTVYRTLALLEELGIVRRIHVDPGCHGYALAGLGHGHHLSCRSCHRVLEFPGREDLAPLILQISRRTGFLIEDDLLELSGTCPSCGAAGAHPRGTAGSRDPPRRRVPSRRRARRACRLHRAVIERDPDLGAHRAGPGARRASEGGGQHDDSGGCPRPGWRRRHRPDPRLCRRAPIRTSSSPPHEKSRPCRRPTSCSSPGSVTK